MVTSPCGLRDSAPDTVAQTLLWGGVKERFLWKAKQRTKIQLYHHGDSLYVEALGCWCADQGCMVDVEMRGVNVVNLSPSLCVSNCFFPVSLSHMLLRWLLVISAPPPSSVLCVAEEVCQCREKATTSEQG